MQFSNLYNDKNTNYSPSANYNYGHSRGHQQNHNHQNRSNSKQQQPRKQQDRFKRDILNVVERMTKQNNVMIKLLKEINERLGGPPAATNKPHKQKPKHHADKKQDKYRESSQHTDRPPSAEDRQEYVPDTTDSPNQNGPQNGDASQHQPLNSLDQSSPGDSASNERRQNASDDRNEEYNKSEGIDAPVFVDSEEYNNAEDTEQHPSEGYQNSDHAHNYDAAPQSLSGDADEKS
ncbi:MAG: hypothetical protein GF398_07645 [Chitinivibrionales bacterium]|nr:hypothetical protein [Chitinivibrionales bacterium]